MKSLNNFSKQVVGFCFAVFVAASCTKNNSESFETTYDFSESSLIQVHMAMVNVSRNYIYVDANPITGALLSSGSIFPSAAYAAAITPGIKSFLVRDTLSTTTQVPLNFGQNMLGGKHYTIFIYDTITTPKQKTVETNIVIPTDTSCRIRFANFIYNPTAVPAVDVFSYALNRNIFVNIPVTDVSNFISYPSRVAVDTLYIRETGTTTNIIKFGLNNTLAQKRNYTLVYRGSHRGTKAATLFANY